MCIRAQRAQSAFSGLKQQQCVCVCVCVCRSAHRSLWSAVTQWWRLEGREWEADCTPGESLKVCWCNIHLLSDTVWSCRKLDYSLTSCLSALSGEPVALWLCQTEEHADSLTHARPERRDLWRPLRELQSAVHTGDDQVRRTWEHENMRKRVFGKHLR